MKHTQSTRVFVAGEDISRYVKRVDLHRVPGEPPTVTLVVDVDRLNVNHGQAVTQVLEIHVAEEL